MRGVGRASAAVTIVNALPTGVGCALGIGLYAEAEVFLQSVQGKGLGSEGELRVASHTRTPLIETTVRLALDRWAPSGPFVTELRLRSEIPASRGLKSSSAVSSAIARAIAASVGAQPTPLEIGRLSAEASRLAGVSATGALDDALAGLLGGFVVTDNPRDELLRSSAPGPGWAAALFVPEASHASSPQWADRFRAFATEGRAAVDAALRGDWWSAMRINTELVERTMGYDYRSLRTRLLSGGALGVGVSGLGPALAAIAPSNRSEELLRTLPEEGGTRTIVSVPSAAPATIPRGA